MPKLQDILTKILSGTSDANIRFADLSRIIKAMGFTERIRGDHFIYSKHGVQEILNIQPLRNGKAKPYQVKQVRVLVTRLRMTIEE